MRTAIGLFLERESAEEAIDALDEAGFGPDEVSVLARREVVEDIVDDERGESAVESAGVGALGGTAVESAGVGALGGTALGGLVGLIAGASALVVPGIGPALAFGTWATVLGTTAAGAGIGAAYGGFVGALIGFGVAEEQTHIYVEGVQQGGILLLVQPEKPARPQIAEKIMITHEGRGVDIVEEPENV